jgi:hypothetical protein
MDRDLAHFLAAIRMLREEGYNLRPPQVNNDGRTTMWTLKYEAVRYDFFLFDSNGANIRWYFHQRKPPLEMINEVPAHGLAEFELYGKRWQVPEQAEDVLTGIYGDWRKPARATSTGDCRAIVERYPGPASGGRPISSSTPLNRSTSASRRPASCRRAGTEAAEAGDLTARSGVLDIEIVSHCWQYAHLLATSSPRS